MFKHNFKYSLKILFRNKSLIFWTFIFPIILGTFFKLAFKDIENNEAFHPFDIAVIESNDFNNNEIFKEAIKSVSKSDNKLFNVKYVSKSDANKLLEDKKVTGYLEFIDNDVNIKINDNGIYETILKFFVDEVNSEKNIINLSINEEVSKGNYDIDNITSNILDKLNSDVNIKNISRSNLSYTMIEYYISCKNTTYQTEDIMRTENEEIRDHLKYLSLLARDYPSQAAAASEIISTQALLKLPKGTEHFMSDLHGENEAFVHILNSASGVIREKVDIVLGESVPEQTRAELATLIYYPNEKLPRLKAECTDEEALDHWYTETLLQLIDICRLVSSKHTREHVRSCLPSSCGYILDELLHAHFEDHDKDLYYGQIVGSIIENGRADRFIVRLCELIKRLAVDKLHIVGDLFDRGPRPDIILDRLMRHHHVDIQWGNHDVVWMGAAAGSPICVCTVLKTTLAYHNHAMLEDCYGINLRHLQRMAEQFYGNDDLTLWMPHTDAARGPYTEGMLHRCAVMHKAVTILMLKMECKVIDRNPDFKMQGRDFLRHIDWKKGTVTLNGQAYPLRDTSFPTVDPADPAALNDDERLVLRKLVESFRQSERLQQHVEFLYAKGSVYHIENGNLLYHGVVPMTKNGSFAVERFEGHNYSGRGLMDYCDERARRGYFAPEGSAARRSGQDFLWYLWCGKLSPLFGRSAMTTFERLYIADPATHEEVKDPYYTWYNEEAACRRILAEFGLPGTSHIVNGHVPVREKSGESPIKGGGRLVVIDGGFCRAYHEKTGIAGYTLVYSSRTMSLRTHQPFVSAEKAVNENIDIVSQKNILETENHRILVEETDEGEILRERVHDLKQLVKAYQLGWIKETCSEDCVW